MKNKTVTTPGCIILLENEQTYVDMFINLFEDMEIRLKLIPCLNTDDYEKKILENNSSLRCIIMDLSNTSLEEDTKQYKATEYIEKEFKENRIPIFVHSGNLEHYTDFPDKGTVFKIPKSKESSTNICKKIKKMDDSNFFNIFCLGGQLEQKIMKELHESFVSQFKRNEIEEIINSVESTDATDSSNRVSEIFERIAIRSLYENWVSTKEIQGKLKEKKFNSIEHYYRRTSDYKIWTGDIFIHNVTNENIVILTPRCNLGHSNYAEILVCKITPLLESVIKEFNNTKVDNKTTGETKGKKSLRTSITDDVTNKRIGERFRFLPPTPQYIGGFIDFITMFTEKGDEILANYTRVISLSDELTNDIVRKFSSYIQRGGISETEFSEAHYYVTSSDDLEKEETKK